MNRRIITEKRGPDSEGERLAHTFLLDNWINGSSASRIAPYLFQVISKRVTKRRAVAEALAHLMWIQNIRGDLSVLVLRDYKRLWQVVADVHLSSDSDRFVWRWHLHCGLRLQDYASRQHLPTGL